MKPMPADAAEYDFTIDRNRYRIENIEELCLIIDYDVKYRGISLNKDRKVIATRLWSEMDDWAQRKFERSKVVQTYGFNLNFAKLEREKGA